MSSVVQENPITSFRTILTNNISRWSNTINIGFEEVLSPIYTSLNNNYLPAFLFYKTIEENGFEKRYTMFVKKDSNEKVIIYNKINFVPENSLENITPYTLVMKNWEKFSSAFKDSPHFKVFKIASIPTNLMVAKNTIFYPENGLWKPLFLLCINKEAIFNLKSPEEFINGNNIIILMSPAIQQYDKVFTFIKNSYFNKYLEQNVEIIYTNNIDRYCYNKQLIVNNRDFKDIPTMMNFLSGNNEEGILKEIQGIFKQKNEDE